MKVSELMVALIVAISFGSCTEKLEVKNSCLYMNDTLFNYYDNGRIKSIIPFSNEKRNGKATWYYSNGGTDAIETFHNNIQVGDAYYYNTKGILSEYLLFDPYGELRCRIIFDSLGFIEKKEGKLLYISLKDNIDSIIVNDDLYININCARIDSFSSILYYTMYQGDLVKIDDTLNITDNLPSLKFNFNTPGVRKLCLHFTLMNKNYPMECLKDSIELDVRVW